MIRLHLLDTSAVLAHLRGDSGAEQVQDLFDRDENSLLLCSLSLAELARRLRELGASSEETWEKINSYLLVIDGVVPVDESVARASESIQLSTPERLPLVDALIAAAARCQGAVLVHRDAHMRAIPVSLLDQLDLGALPSPQ